MEMDDRILDQSVRQDFPEDFNQHKPGIWDWIKSHALLISSVAMVLLLVVVATLYFLRNQGDGTVEPPNVLLNIKGPEQIASGNETEFRIVYTNGENSDLTGITLEVFYPSNFKYVSAEPSPSSSNGQRFDLPVLRQGQTGEVVIKAKVSGATGEVKELRSKLSFRMSNFSSDFFTETSFKTALTAPELEMEITGPIDVTNGQNTTFTINYKNVSGKEFDATAVQLAYPEGFMFVSAEPAPSKDNNYWSLGKLGVDTVGKIEVTGNFIGDPGSEQQVSGDLGLVLNSGLAPQIHASARFKLQASSLAIQHSTDKDVVKLGETMQYRLKYANYGSVSQSNVVITVTIEGPSLDLTKLRSTNGIITGNTITWKSATVSNLSLLSPNQTGDLDFSVGLKPNITTNLKNQTVKTAVSIYSDQVTSPIRGEEKIVKVESELGMTVSGRYVSGALPMKVGESTTFEVTVTLTNLSNDLADGELLASMPLPASAWINVIAPDAEKQHLTFDQNASKIRWRLGNIPAFQGRFSVARSVSFQLQVTPSEANRGQNMTLLRDIQAVATDTFTGKEIKSTQLSTLTVSDLNDSRIDSVGSTIE